MAGKGDPTQDEGDLGGDYARDTHREGYGDDYARESHAPGTAARGDLYGRTEHGESVDVKKPLPSTEPEVRIGKAGE